MNEKNTKSMDFFETKAKIKESVFDMLNKSEKILSKIRQKFGEDSIRYKKAKKEYDDIQRSIRESLKNDREITQKELALIELEFVNLLRFKLNDDRLVVSFLNKTGRISGFFGVDLSKMDFLGDSTKVTNHYQEELIKRVLGKDYERGYNGRYLKGYNSDIGNFLVRVDDFEKQIAQGNIRDVNSLALANYFSYLESCGKLNIDTLLDKMGIDNIYGLRNIWLNPRDGYSLVAKKRLERTKGGRDLIFVIEMFSGIDRFLSGIYKLNQEQIQLALKLLRKDLNLAKERFRKDLYERFIKSNPNLNKSEIDKIIEEILVKTLKFQSLGGLREIYRIFSEYNKKYKLGLNIPEETRELIEVHKKQTQLELVEIVRKTMESKGGNSSLTNEQRKKELQLKELELMYNAIPGIGSANDVQQIVSGKSNFVSKISNIFGIKLGQDNSNSSGRSDHVSNSVIDIAKTKPNQNNSNPSNPNSTKGDKNKEPKNENSRNKGKNPTQINSRETLIGRQKSTLFYPDGTRLNYFQAGSIGWYLVETRRGSIEVNSQELDIIRRNKNALDNIVRFKEILDELNLGGLFRYREGIFRAISNKDMLAFNANDDYLNENELIIFIRAVLQSIGYNPSNVTDLNLLKSEVKNINKVGLIGGMRDVNMYGDSYIEREFIERFDPKRTSILNQSAFEKSLGELTPE